VAVVVDVVVVMVVADDAVVEKAGSRNALVLTSRRPSQLEISGCNYFTCAELIASWIKLHKSPLKGQNSMNLKEAIWNRPTVLLTQGKSRALKSNS
jgi:hypothetical protein